MVSTAGFWMKRVLRVLGQAFVILLIVLALDYVLLATVFSDLKRNWADGATAYTHAYMSSPLLHHTLAPNQNSERPWGNIVYHFQTDKYGYRTGPCAATDDDKGKPAIFAVGDSFTEALGVPYEQSFVGLMACDAAKQGKAVWNLGVTSYSPLIYQRKIREAAEKLGIKPAEIYVFLDVSDIDDEANVYRVEENGDVKMTLFYHWFDTGQFLLGNFATFRLAYDLWLRSPFSAAGSYGRERASWTFDPELMEAWGKRGLELADKNMDVVVDICREWKCQITLVVYPWPDNVAAGDRDSIQVRHWRDWAASRGVRFVDGFAPFFRAPADVAVRKYYIRGDTHFNAAGHRLLFEELRRAAGEL
jgi:hypothetical protein